MRRLIFLIVVALGFSAQAAELQKRDFGGESWFTFEQPGQPLLAFYLPSREDSELCRGLYAVYLIADSREQLADEVAVAALGRKASEIYTQQICDGQAPRLGVPVAGFVKDRYEDKGRGIIDDDQALLKAQLNPDGFDIWRNLAAAEIEAEQARAEQLKIAEQRERESEQAAIAAKEFTAARCRNISAARQDFGQKIFAQCQAATAGGVPGFSHPLAGVWAPSSADCLIQPFVISIEDGAKLTSWVRDPDYGLAPHVETALEHVADHLILSDYRVYAARNDGSVHLQNRRGNHQIPVKTVGADVIELARHDWEFRAKVLLRCDCSVYVDVNAGEPALCSR